MNNLFYHLDLEDYFTIEKVVSAEMAFSLHKWFPTVQ